MVSLGFIALKYPWASALTLLVVVVLRHLRGMNLPCSQAPGRQPVSLSSCNFRSPSPEPRGPASPGYGGQPLIPI